MAFKDLRSSIEDLKRRDLLFSIDRLIDKDSELMPLVRWQYRGLAEAERRGFLFTNVTDGRGRTYDASVAVAVLGASRRVYAAALGCPVAELRDRWIRAAASPITPVVIKSAGAPVKEEIHGPDEVGREGFGLDEFPVPLSTPGYDPPPSVTSGHWVTKDLETGVRNVGNYRGHVKAPDRLGLQLFPTQHEGIHWLKRRERGQDLEAAIVIGAPPTVAMTAVAKLPYGVDEYAVAGALSGEPALHDGHPPQEAVAGPAVPGAAGRGRARADVRQDPDRGRRGHRPLRSRRGDVGVLHADAAPPRREDHPEPRVDARSVGGAT